MITIGYPLPLNASIQAVEGPFSAVALQGRYLRYSLGLGRNLDVTEAAQVAVIDKNQRRKRSPRACFMTWPPTSEMDLVRGISLGQTSTQFCA